jgi:hypothetical protein
MKKEEAVKLIDCFHAAQRSLADAAEQIKSLDNKEEADSLKRTIAHAIGTIAADAIAPILQLYPELDPYAEED